MATLVTSSQASWQRPGQLRVPQSTISPISFPPTLPIVTTSVRDSSPARFFLAGSRIQPTGLPLPAAPGLPPWHSLRNLRPERPDPDGVPQRGHSHMLVRSLSLNPRRSMNGPPGSVVRSSAMGKQALEAKKEHAVFACGDDEGLKASERPPAEGGRESSGDGGALLVDHRPGYAAMPSGAVEDGMPVPGDKEAGHGRASARGSWSGSGRGLRREGGSGSVEARSSIEIRRGEQGEGEEGGVWEWGGRLGSSGGREEDGVEGGKGKGRMSVSKLRLLLKQSKPRQPMPVPTWPNAEWGGTWGEGPRAADWQYEKLAKGGMAAAGGGVHLQRRPSRAGRGQGSSGKPGEGIGMEGGGAMSMEELVRSRRGSGDMGVLERKEAAEVVTNFVRLERKDSHAPQEGSGAGSDAERGDRGSAEPTEGGSGGGAADSSPPPAARSTGEVRSPSSTKDGEERTASVGLVRTSTSGALVSSPKKSGSLRNLAAGKGAEADPPKLRKGTSERLLEDPPPRTNVIPKSTSAEGPTVSAEQWARARKAQMERFKGSAEDERTLRGWLSTLRSKKGLQSNRRLMVLVGGNKSVRKTLGDRGFEEVPDKEGDGTAFELKWTLSHYDINFEALLPCQFVNHFPNSGCELGAKVGMHRNLRALRWFDKVDMDEFFPRMYNLANPWEMQDFVEDFIFTAACVEVVRASQGLAATTAAAANDPALSLSILEAAHGICTRFLDNKAKLEGREEGGLVAGVLCLEDYFKLRPDTRATHKIAPSEPMPSSWAALEEEAVQERVGAMMARLRQEHKQLHADGVRNVWILKPGHGSRGRGIKCFDDLQRIISCASARKKGAVVQKYVENCLLVDNRKFDIRAWVLVTSWNPLTVWMYEPYIRICVDQHSLEPAALSNQFKHLCNRCVQAKSDEYDDDDEEEGGCMWSVETLTNYLEKQYGDGEGKWRKIRQQLKSIALYTMHSVQDLIDNRPGCFEWFGLDFMVDTEYNVWTLECNISPDLSKGTEVLERLVPGAMEGLWDMLLMGPEARDSAEYDPEHCWDLVYRGREIKREVLQKRFWLRKNLMTELRARRPFSMRDALTGKLGGLTTTFLCGETAKTRADKAKRAARRAKAKKAKEEEEKKGQEESSDEEDDEDEDGEAEE